MPTRHGRALALTTALCATAFAPRMARAEDPPAPESAAAEGPAKPEVQPSKAPERQVSLDPSQSEVAPSGRTTFDIDPIADSAMIAVSLGFAGTLELINSTGEIRPQQIDKRFDRSQLIWIDRGAATQTPDPNAGRYSTIGLGVAVAYALIDPIMSGVREKSVQTGVADAFMYAEALSFTMAMTNIVKMAVRRPRPIAYIDAAAHKDDPNYTNGSTDSALSLNARLSLRRWSILAVLLLRSRSDHRDHQRHCHVLGFRPRAAQCAPLDHATGGYGPDHVRVDRARSRRSAFSDRRNRRQHCRCRHGPSRTALAPHGRHQATSHLGGLHPAHDSRRRARRSTQREWGILKHGVYVTLGMSQKSQQF